MERTEADAVADIAAKNTQPFVLEIKGDDAIGYAAVVPEGFELQSIEEYLNESRLYPQRRKGTATLGDLDSFIAWTNRFKDEESVVFACSDASKPSLTAVTNYNKKGGADADGQRFGDHKGHYAFPLSDEWTAWRGVHKQPLSQSGFAEFIEERIMDIGDPAAAGEVAKQLAAAVGAEYANPSAMLAASRGIKLRVGTALTSAINLDNGEVDLQYTVENKDPTGGKVQVPGAFLIAVPVFKNGALYSIPARLRYRHRDGDIKWFIDLHQVERFIDHAIREALGRATKETELPLFVGSPE